MSAEHDLVAFADDADLDGAASAFLAEGLARGERVSFLGWGGRDALRGRLRGLAGLDDLVARGTAHVVSLDERFGDEAPDPVALQAFWADAADAALHAGFTGLCAVADTTRWAQPPGQRTVFLRGHHLVDRYRLDHPFALLCACDAAALADDALAEVASVHAPTTRERRTPFHLHPSAAADFALDGEIDAFAVPLLERLLTVVAGDEGGRDVLVEAGGLEFVDPHTLLALERHGQRCDADVVLHHAPPTAGLLAELLGLRRVRVEAPR